MGNTVEEAGNGEEHESAQPSEVDAEGSEEFA